MGDNVILVGFMGAGKSSVGRLLARRMGRFFAERGEAHFRALEEETVRLLALKSGDVIATGGGLYCREGRPEALRAIGTVVWLTGSFDVLYERARRVGERPMLAGRTRDEVAAIYHARETYYRQADLTVDTTDRNTDQVVTQVLLALRPHLSLSPLGRGPAEGDR